MALLSRLIVFWITSRRRRMLEAADSQVIICCPAFTHWLRSLLCDKSAVTTHFLVTDLFTSLTGVRGRHEGNISHQTSFISPTYQLRQRVSLSERSDRRVHSDFQFGESDSMRRPQNARCRLDDSRSRTDLVRI